jgi:hypothetical protein
MPDFPSSDTYGELAKARDLGYEVYGPQHLAGMAGDASVAQRPSTMMPVNLLAPNTGQAPMAAGEAMYRYNQLTAPKIHAQGGLTPPKVAPSAMPPALEAEVDDILQSTFGDSTDKLFPNFKGTVGDDEWTSLAVEHPDGLVKALQKELGIDETQAEFLKDTWMTGSDTMAETLAKHHKPKPDPGVDDMTKLNTLYDEMVAKGAFADPAKPSPISSAPPEMLDESWPDNKAFHEWYADKEVFDGSQAGKTNKELKAEYLDWIAKGAPPQGELNPQKGIDGINPPSIAPTPGTGPSKALLPK